MKIMDLIRGRKALSQVLTKLMILVVSILTASGTVTYTIALTSSSLRQEQLTITETYVWVIASGARARGCTTMWTRPSTSPLG